MQEQANKTHYSWRTEAEIDFERQEFLRQRLAVRADIQRGVYPFKDVKLGRADVEWLLIAHEEGRGPIDLVRRTWRGLFSRERIWKELPCEGRTWRRQTSLEPT